jgi:hypothetical protein
MAQITAQNLIVKAFGAGIQLNVEEVDAEVKKIIAGSAPAAVADLRNQGKNDLEIAVELADSFYAAQGGTPAADPSKGTATQPAASTMSAEEESAVRMALDSTAKAREDRLAATKVDSVLTDKPVLYQIFIPGTKMKFSQNANMKEKFDQWEGKLVNTDENKARFQAIKDAYEQGQEVDVYVNDKARQKVIGYAITTTDANGAPQRKDLTVGETAVFLMTEVPGYIPARDKATSIGVRLRWQEASNAGDPQAQGTKATGSILVSIMNNKARKDNQLDVCTSKIVEVAGQKEIAQEHSVRSDMYFEVYTGKNNKKDQPITRKVRLSGKCPVYATARIPDYEKFEPKSKTTGMSKKMQQTTQENLYKSYAAFASGKANIGGMTAAMTTAKAEAMQNIAKAKGAAGANFG